MTKQEYRKLKDEFYRSSPFDYVLGCINPYTNTVIRDRYDYELYAHCYALKQKAEICLNERVSEIENRYRLEYEQKNIELSSDLLSAKQTISYLEHTGKLRFVFLCILSVLLVVFSLLFSFRPSRSDYQSLQEQVSALAAENESLSNRVDQSFLDGQSSGYSSGYADGYGEGQSRSPSSTAPSSKEPPTYNRGSPSYDDSVSVSTSYIGNAKSKKFHKSTCSYLPDKSNQVALKTRDDAISGGYDPCGHCNP